MVSHKHMRNVWYMLNNINKAGSRLEKSAYAAASTAYQEYQAQEIRKSIPLWKRLKLYHRGDTSMNWALFGYGKEDKDEYITTYRWSLTWTINPEERTLLENKLYFNLLLERLFPEHVPSNYGYLRDGSAFDFSKESEINDTVNWLARLARKHGILVIKPVNGAGGDGVYTYTPEDNPNDILDNLDKDKDHIITEFINQGEYINSVYPETANTVRLIRL